MESTITQNDAVSWSSRITRFPFERINWTTSSFLIGTLALTLTAVPLYLSFFGLDRFQVSLFFVMLLAIGFSITVGYHRLYSHITFQASWPVRLFTLIFGAAAFENSALMWASEHRRHHKHVDHDDDPYSISKGFFYAHIGRLIFKLKVDQSYDNVPDLMKDKLVRWQHRYVQVIAVVVSFVLPAVAGALWNGCAWRPRGLLDRGRCPDRCFAALHILDQQRLPHIRHPAVFDKVLCTRFLAYGTLNYGGGLPQLSSRIST